MGRAFGPLSRARLDGLADRTGKLRRLMGVQQLQVKAVRCADGVATVHSHETLATTAVTDNWLMNRVVERAQWNARLASRAHKICVKAFHLKSRRTLSDNGNYLIAFLCTFSAFISYTTPDTISHKVSVTIF